MHKCRYWNMCCVCYENQCNSQGQVTKNSGTGYTYEACKAYKPMPDVRALMTLADECDSVHIHKVAARIRDALGMNNG